MFGPLVFSGDVVEPYRYGERRHPLKCGILGTASIRYAS